MRWVFVRYKLRETYNQFNGSKGPVRFSSVNDSVEMTGESVVWIQSVDWNTIQN